MRAAGLEQYRVAGIGQHRHQRQHVFLQERLAAGDLDERTVKRGHCIDNLLQSLLLSLVKGVLGIAIITTQIAEC